MPLSYGRIGNLVAPDDFALPRSGMTSRSDGSKAEHEGRANVDLRFVRALLCLSAKGLAWMAAAVGLLAPLGLRPAPTARPTRCAR